MYDHWHRTAFQSEGLPAIRLPDNDGIVSNILERNPALITENRFDGGVTRYRGWPQSQAEFRRDYKRDILRAALATGAATADHLRIEAHLDQVDRSRVCGWLWTPLMPDHRFGISVWLHGTLLARGMADRFRGDLQLAGKGDGRYAFEQLFPGPLQADTDLDAVEVRIDGTDLVLRRNAGASS
jgi:hypothetical protein